MSDTSLTITLPPPLADEVRAAAEAEGLSPEDYVRQQLAFDVGIDAEEDDLSWEEDLRRLEEPGKNIDAEAVFADIRARLAARVAPTRK